MSEARELAQINGLAAIIERDIDLLIYEEIEVNAHFRTWLLCQVSPDLCDAVYDRAWHSLLDAGLGQSDVVVRVTASGSKTGILIENKIDAPFTERQPERYRERGVDGVRRGWWGSFRTLLLAPTVYLKNCDQADFDRQLSYENIAEWFEVHKSNPRMAFKAGMLREAISQARRGYTKIPDDAKTTFAFHYWQMADTQFPSLALAEPAEKGKKGVWCYFTKVGLPSRIKLVHKIDCGSCVDLLFSNPRADELRRLCIGCLEPDMRIEPTGKSTVIRVRVPKVDSSQPFEPQTDAARIGLQTVQRLLRFFQENRSTFETFLNS